MRHNFTVTRYRNDAEARAALLDYSMTDLLPKSDYVDIGYGRRLTIGNSRMFLERMPPRCDPGLYESKLYTAEFLWWLDNPDIRKEGSAQAQTAFAEYLSNCERTKQWDEGFVSLVFSLFFYYNIIKYGVTRHRRRRREMDCERLVFKARHTWRE